MNEKIPNISNQNNQKSQESFIFSPRERKPLAIEDGGEIININSNDTLNEKELKYARDGKIYWRHDGTDYVHPDGIMDNELTLTYRDNERWFLDGKCIYDTVKYIDTKKQTSIYDIVDKKEKEFNRRLTHKEFYDIVKENQ